MIPLNDFITSMPAGLDRAILRILSFHKGAENAISRFMLRGDCGRHGYHINDRTLRAAINHLRKQGEPICSMGGENGGYYMATSKQELEDYIIREPQARINDFYEQIKAMRAHYPQDNQLRMI